MRAVPALRTARLRLRPRTVDDAEALFPSFADAALMRWWSHAPHRSVEQTRARFAEPSGDWRAWAITLAGRDGAEQGGACDDTAIGFVVAGEKRQGNVSEIGYLLARAHWGRGIAHEAVAAVLDQVLIAERQRRAFADTDPENEPSKALLHALGFVVEGHLRQEWETHLGVRDTLLWGLLADEWRARR